MRHVTAVARTCLRGRNVPRGCVPLLAVCLVAPASVSAATSASPYATTVLGTPGLVSYWHLDEASGTLAADSSGTNPGSYAGAGGYTLGAPGLIASDADRAVVMNGTIGVVTVPDSAGLHPGAQLSLEAWVRPAASSDQTGRYIATKPSSFRLRFDSSDRLTFSVYLNGVEVGARAAAGVATTGTSHVVGTYDGAYVRLYVNGAEVATAAAAGTVSASTSALSIGSSGGTSWHFDGTVDEVAVYRAALAATAVQSHYSQATSVAPPPAPLPTVSITSGPAAGSTQSTGGAAFGFVANRLGSTFACQLDGAPYAACSSPVSYTGLTNGSHTFSVKATAGGLVSLPSTVTWTTAVPSVTSSCRAPFAAASPWNVPIAPTATYSSSSAAYVATMSGLTLTSDPTQYTYPVYYVNNNTPLRNVTYSGWFSNATNGGGTLTNFRFGGNLLQQVTQVPIPTGAAPSAGSDGNIILINTDNGDEWDMHQFSTDSLGNASVTNVGHYNTAWSGVPPVDANGNPYWLRGSGVPYVSGLIRPCEIAQGHIDHAIAFAYPNTTAQFQYPASKSDGAAPAGAGMPEGVRLRLDPSVTDTTIQTQWGCKAACFTVAKAMQKYGMYLIDGSGRAKVMMEDDATAHWGTTMSSSTVSPIPLGAFKALP